ncbi:MAG: hypothetical protein HDT26_00955 [Subdoligranulum sp.]|nr:hypothetical protein [Subdoligranulum sp.]
MGNHVNGFLPSSLKDEQKHPKEKPVRVDIAGEINSGKIADVLPEFLQRRDTIELEERKSPHDHRMAVPKQSRALAPENAAFSALFLYPSTS